MSTLASRRKIKWGADRLKGSGNPAFNGGQYMDEKGYIRVSRGDHPHQNHGYVYMHRLVMEKLLGRYMCPWESVHHINEIKLDNRPENLYLTTMGEHTIIHREGKKASKESRKEKSDATRERNKNAARVGGRFVKSKE
jgi:hypothetical protein